MKPETRRKLMRTPVIGHAIALAMLPNKIMETQDALERLQRENEMLREKQDALWQSCEERWVETCGRLDHQDSHLTETRNYLEQKWQTELNAFHAELNSFGEKQKKEIPEYLMTRAELLSRLRTQLSVQPALWGPAERLYISPEAAVDSCMMNTNSGEIHVGAYTFAGPGVSLITGSHDPRLRGFLRRDICIEQGCDIEIGRGVWLCANCTVLGPCTIGDNAVIAAGAVVVPGTRVEAGSIYAGIPARKVKDVPPEGDAEAQIMDRLDGCLFTEGWFAGETLVREDQEYPGHWMIRQEAKIRLRAGETAFCFFGPVGEGDERQLTVTMNSWTEQRKIGGGGIFSVPESAFEGRAEGILLLRVDELLSLAESGDPRTLGVFVSMCSGKMAEGGPAAHD